MVEGNQPYQDKSNLLFSLKKSSLLAQWLLS